MSYTATMTSRLTVAGRQFKFLLKLSVFGLFLVSAGFICYKVYHSPRYQKYLPAMAHNVIRDAKTIYYSEISDDLVVFSKTIKAKALRAKQNKVIRYSNGLAAASQYKFFEINDELSTSVKVEVFGSSGAAFHMLRAFGGNETDQLGVGAPSFFKTHGVDDDGSYYLTLLSQVQDKLVTVTYYKQLGPRELRVVNSNRYESYVGSLADNYLEPAIIVSEIQVAKSMK